jgi:membrane-bound lytic murein transglycosylase A
MRTLLCTALLLAAISGGHAQSPAANRGNAVAIASLPRAKPCSVAPAHFAAVKTSALKFEPPEASAGEPEAAGAETVGQIPREPLKIADTQLETIEWGEIDGWGEDNHATAFRAFLKSCKTVIVGTSSPHAGQPFFTALQSVCRRALKTPRRDRAAARIFFEKNFRPMRIARLGVGFGFLTGYYEPIIEGSRVKSAEFNVPLYRMPGEVAKREPGTRYYDRAAIEDGVLAGRKLEICWLKDPTDLFFAQIQGSARVKLEDGSVLRLNYSGHNGWPYTAIGRILIDREIVPKEEMSMDRIREWIEANPKEGKELRRRNRSYVFFRETGLSEFEEPVGAQGISLIPGRSIAVDKSFHVYGTPFFIEAELPIDGENSENNFGRLMIAQDTGSAIRGPARADLYFGSGNGPAHVAGRIRHPGQFTILIPREIDPVVAGTQTPLPRPRPAFANSEIVVEKSSERPESEPDRAAPVSRSLP